MVGDVGHEVGGFAVAPVEHAVLVVAELSCAQPLCAVQFVGCAALAQALHGPLHGTRLHEIGFALPVVETDVHGIQRLTNVTQRPLAAPRRCEGDTALRRQIGRRTRVVSTGADPQLGRQLLSPLDDVLAVVAVVGHRLASRPCRERTPEQLHLGAAVVDVVLGDGAVAAAPEQTGEAVAKGTPTTAAGVQRAGGVRGDELEVHSSPVADVEARVPLGALA